MTLRLPHNDESNYRAQIENVVNWCDDNNLILNVSKTKEIVIDFRRIKSPVSPLSINGTDVEQVSSFKFLGTHISNDLSWSVNSAEILKKANQRLYFLRKLKAYGVSQCILVNFYRAIIESVLTSSITVWYGRVSKSEVNKLSSVIRSAEKDIGTKLPSLDSIYLERTTKKTEKNYERSDSPCF